MLIRKISQSKTLIHEKYDMKGKKLNKSIINGREWSKIIEKFPDAIIVIDLEGNIIECNQAALNISVFNSKEELIGFNGLNAIHPEDQKRMKRDIKNLLLVGVIKDKEYRILNKEGRILPVEISASVIFDDFDNPNAFICILKDITERKNAEQKLKERSKNLKILNKIIITTNRSGSVKSLLKDVLEQTLNLLPFDGGEIYLIDKEMGIAKVFHSKGTLKSFKTLKINEQPHRLIYINGKSAFRSDLDKYSLDINIGSDLQSIAIVPIFSEGEIIGSLTLVSKKKHYFTEGEKELIKSIGNKIGNVIGKLIAEEEMEKLIEELKRSNEELEQFAYITSHDLQEPLRTIASFTQLLERRYKGRFDSDADEFIDYIVDASVRMKQMIQGLLEYSRIGKGGLEFKPVNLDKVLTEVLSNLKAVIEKNNAEITCEKLPEVIGDSKLLLHLFQNLIGNAIKFRKPDRPPQIYISFFDNKNEYKDVFCIEDNGIGIDPQFSNRIFKVFKRLHTIDQYNGTGIGLATCKRIVEYHGGHIWVESELDKGSKFYFTLNHIAQF